MWLINCENSNYTLEEFLEERAPPYAILSHRWGEDEVSFQQMQSLGAIERPAGFAKIEMCCKTAFRQSIEYVWVDTCYIDKANSSALQEAINSMFRWYQRAKVCYAYLSDVPSGLHEKEEEKAFQNSLWFTRGWTLQELIAPQKVWFYDQSWTKCGTKLSRGNLISEITSIQQEVLGYLTRDLSQYSIAQKMCWASHRTTTRPEDMAYCLLGIFDINMTLIYGEGGQRAFIRLQEAIMQDSDDQSIFAWKREIASVPIASGLLADSPGLFMKCGDIVELQNWHEGEPFQITNRGLRIKLPLIEASEDGKGNEKVFFGALACQSKNEPHSVVGISLSKVHNSSDQYVRTDSRAVPIPIERLWNSIPSSQFSEDFRTLLNLKPRNLYRWIYVRKRIRYPKKEELESPGDVIAFRINSSGFDHTGWDISSYPIYIADNWPGEIKASKTDIFRWNPAVWSWHAVILFTANDTIASSKTTKNFFLATGWDGPAEEEWTHLGVTTQTDAQVIFDRFVTKPPKQICEAIKLKQADEFLEYDVSVSTSEIEAKDDMTWFEVELKIDLSRPSKKHRRK